MRPLDPLGKGWSASAILCRLQSCPVESYADPGRIGRNRKAIFKPKRSGRMAIDGKAMDFKPTGIFPGRDKAHMKLLHSVAAHRNSMSLGQLSNPFFKPRDREGRETDLLRELCREYL